MQLIQLGANQMHWRYKQKGSKRMKPACDDNTPESAVSDSPWNERVLMAAVIVTMLLSLFGYMHG